MQPDEFLAEFDQTFADIAKRARTGQFTPNCDVYVEDDGKTIVVNVELAGADPDELRVGVEQRALLIIGRRVDRSAKQRDFLQKEIEYGEFCKKVHLPVPVVYETVTATYQDGFLTIRLQRAAHVALPTSRAELHLVIQRIIA